MENFKIKPSTLFLSLILASYLFAESVTPWTKPAWANGPFDYTTNVADVNNNSYSGAGYSQWAEKSQANISNSNLTLKNNLQKIVAVIPTITFASPYDLSSTGVLNIINSSISRAENPDIYGGDILIAGSWAKASNFKSSGGVREQPIPINLKGYVDIDNTSMQNYSGGSIYGAVLGSTSDGNVSGYVEMNNGTVSGSVYGAVLNGGLDADMLVSPKAYAFGNLDLRNSIIEKNIVGSQAVSLNTSGNNDDYAIAQTQDLYLSNVKAGQSGSYSVSGSDANSTTNAKATAKTDNFVVENGSILGNASGNPKSKFYGAKATSSLGNAEANLGLLQLASENGAANEIHGDLIGAYAKAQNDASATTKQLYINNSKVGVNTSDTANNLIAAYAYSTSGNANSSVEGNFSILNGSSVDGNLTGAYANSLAGNATANLGNFLIQNSTFGNAGENSYLNGAIALAKENAEANTNIFNFFGDSLVKSKIYGSYAKSENANASATTKEFILQNITNEGGNNDNIYAAYAYAQNGKASASNSLFYINNADIGTQTDDYIYGVYAQGKEDANASIDGNFTIKNSKVNGDIIALYADSNNGNARASLKDFFIDNSTIVSAGETIYGIQASATKDINASLTSFNILNSSQLTSNVYGISATGKNVNASLGTLNILNEKAGAKNKIDGSVFGVLISTNEGNSTAKLDNVNIKNSEIDDSLTLAQSNSNYAATSEKAQANVGNVLIQDSSISGSITGGAYAYITSQDPSTSLASAEANLNLFEFFDSNASSLYLAQANSDGSSAKASINEGIWLNNANIENFQGSFASSNGQADSFIKIIDTNNIKVENSFYGAYASGKNANALLGKDEGDGLYINNSSINSLYGAYAHGTDTALAETKYIQILNSELGYIMGAEANGDNGATVKATIMLSDSNLSGNIILAEASSNSGLANASGNTLTLDDTKVGGNIILGYASSGVKAQATNNTLNLYGKNEFGANSELWGGFNDLTATTSDLVSGNTFNFYAGASPITVAKLRNFENYNIEVAGKVSDLFTNDASKALITVTNELGNDGGKKAQLAIFNSGITFADGQSLTAGDKMYILNAQSADLVGGSSMSDLFVLKNPSINVGLIYSADIELGSDGSKTVYAEISGSERDNPEDNLCFIDGTCQDNTSSALGFEQIDSKGKDLAGDRAALNTKQNYNLNIIISKDDSAKELWFENGTLSGNLTGIAITSTGGFANLEYGAPIILAGGANITGSLLGASSTALNDANASSRILISNENTNTNANNIGGNIIGASADSSSKNANATSNLGLSNTTVGGDIILARAQAANGDASASGSTAMLTNSTVNGNVYLGYLGTSGQAINNTLILDENVTFGANSEIWGGYSAISPFSRAAGSKDLVSGNTFQLYTGDKQLKVAKLRNFENYDIFVTGDGAAKFNNDASKALIIVTDELGNDNLITSTNSKVNGTYKAQLSVADGGMTFADGQKLKLGDKMYIINAEGANLINGSSMSDLFVLKNEQMNVGLIYAADLALGNGADKTVYAEITDTDRNNPAPETDKPTLPGTGEKPENGGSESGGATKPEIKPNPKPPVIDPVVPVVPTDPDGSTEEKPYVPNEKSPLKVDKNAVDRLKPTLEGQLASLMSINKGADLVINNFLRTIELDKEGSIVPFGAFEGGKDKYKSGSHVKTTSYNFLVGSGYNFTNTVVGWFFEYGRGNYHTYNNFPAYGKFSALNFKGDGKAINHGIGLLGKTYFGNAYVDASVRLGRSKNKFSTDSYTAGNYRAVDPNYTVKASYYGAHAGLGYKFKTGANEFDSSAKYIFSHLNGSNTTIDATELKLDAVNSHRARIGEDYSYEANKYLNLKAGLAYEYEFNAKAKGKIAGNNIKAPSTKGSTGIGELGLSVKPFGGDKNKAIDFAVKGYVGKHQGGSGNIQFRYNF